MIRRSFLRLLGLSPIAAIPMVSTLATAEVSEPLNNGHDMKISIEYKGVLYATTSRDALEYKSQFDIETALIRTAKRGSVLCIKEAIEANNR